MANKTSVTCYYLDSAHVVCDGRNFNSEDFIGPSQPWFWGYLSIYVALVLFAGLVSGLTMGLLSQDTMNLEVLTKSSEPKEQKYATVILKLVSKHHLLLVTLLLANAAAVEAMPIFLNQIANEVIAVVVSVTAVLLFGEIIPQALCTRYGLAIGYYCAPVVWIMMVVLLPIAFPLAKLLDCVLGKEHDVFFRRAGLVSGLTMGLLSQDTMNLEVLTKSSGPKEQKYATVILKLVSKHHLLLVTLLVANAVAVEAMPLFINQIANEVIAVVVSVTAVLLFGEIIPQALCTRYSLAIGYYCAPVVWIMMVVLFPIAFPLAKLLDCVLGKEHDVFFRRAELRELINIHASKRVGNKEPLSYSEVLIVKNALDMKDKTVKDAMTSIDAVFMLNCNDNIDTHTRDQILLRGYSRVPVYADRKDNIVGMLLVKRLIKLDSNVCTPIYKLEEASMPPPTCLASTPLYNLLNQFQTGKSHLALVYSDEPSEDGQHRLLGIITLEDVIEELIGEEILDETDLYVTMQRRVRLKRSAVDMQRRVAIARAKLAHHRQRLANINPEAWISKRFTRGARMSLVSISDLGPEADPFEGIEAPSYGSV